MLHFPCLHIACSVLVNRQLVKYVDHVTIIMFCKFNNFDFLRFTVLVESQVSFYSMDSFSSQTYTYRSTSLLCLCQSFCDKIIQLQLFDLEMVECEYSDIK